MDSDRRTEEDDYCEQYQQQQLLVNPEHSSTKNNVNEERKVCVSSIDELMY